MTYMHSTATSRGRTNMDGWMEFLAGSASRRLRFLNGSTLFSSSLLAVRVEYSDVRVRLFVKVFCPLLFFGVAAWKREGGHVTMLMLYNVLLYLTGPMEHQLCVRASRTAP